MRTIRRAALRRTIRGPVVQARRDKRAVRFRKLRRTIRQHHTLLKRIDTALEYIGILAEQR